MATDKIEFDDVGMETAAKKIEEAATRIDEAMRKIESNVSDLDSVWNDVNSKKYAERFNELKQEFPKFSNATHSYSKFLLEVVKEYREKFLEETSTRVN